MNLGWAPNWRIWISRLVVAMVVCMACLTGSVWTDRSLMVGELLVAAGVVLVGVATIGRVWCSVYIAGCKLNRLGTGGPCSLGGNPLYFFSFCGIVGVGFATRTFAIPLTLAILFAIYYPLVIRAEERALRLLHGNDFDAYCATAPRFIPRLSGRLEPATYEIYPPVLFRQLWDCIWFAVGFAGFLTLNGLHAAGALPVFWRLY